MILISVAMEDECYILKDLLGLEEVGDNEFAGGDFALICTGVGKVNAAMGTQYGIDKYKPEMIINYGFVGSMSEEYKVGDFVFPQMTLQHDFDLTPLGYPPFTVQGQSKSTFKIKGYDELKEVIHDLKKCKYLLTGDRFMTDKLPGFEDAICDMEGYAVARVAHKAKIPCYMVKMVSDSCNKEGADRFAVSVDEFKRELQNYVFGFVCK